MAPQVFLAFGPSNQGRFESLPDPHVVPNQAFRDDKAEGKGSSHFA